jgi:hypothetical protein
LALLHTEAKGDICGNVKVGEERVTLEYGTYVAFLGGKARDVGVAVENSSAIGFFESADYTQSGAFSAT